MKQTRLLIFAALALLLSACGMNMYDQPRVEWQETSRFLPEDHGSQPIP